jgi:hypothetical protein
LSKISLTGVPTVLTAQLSSFAMLHIVDNGELWIVCMRMDGNKNPPILKEKIINWAAGVGHINALECAQNRGMYGDAESCMWAAFNDHLHVFLKWL